MREKRKEMPHGQEVCKTENTRERKEKFMEYRGILLYEEK